MTMKPVLACLVVLLCPCIIFADVYLHNIPGSNNKLNEQANTVNNANRLFDSQNNGNGGYQTRRQYYYVGSTLRLEYTAQHSCGGNTNCEIIWQYTCEDIVPGLRDGATTDTIPDDPNQSQDIKYGQHEGYNYYQECKQRDRNKGLLTLDQITSNSQGSALYTRQDNNGANNRHGFECPEERDYYPYWHPSPWIDIAVATTDMTRCSYYQDNSQNVADKGKCVGKPKYNNQADCQNNGGAWTMTGKFGVDPPLCMPTCWSRDNHLGNTWGAEPCHFDWTVPDHVSERCVLRVRYNISTTDYDSWNTFAAGNTNPAGSSPVTVPKYAADTAAKPLTRNPTIAYAGLELQMAVNTDQYGRTFQDRTHVFEIRERPADVPADAKIVNLNVRGRRGNIVQVFPSVEYDFIPNRLAIKPEDYVHLQWSGSNRNAQGNDGRGLAGTDRNNFVQMSSIQSNYPFAMSNWTMLNDTNLMTRLILSNSPQMGGDTRNLDDAGTYFDAGLLRFPAGTYAYKSTRNDNFSNRSQKGIIYVLSIPQQIVNVLSTGEVTSIVVGSVTAASVFSLGLLKKFAPSKFSKLFGKFKFGGARGAV